MNGIFFCLIHGIHKLLGSRFVQRLFCFCFLVVFEKVTPDIHIIGRRIYQPQSGGQQNKWAYF